MNLLSGKFSNGFLITLSAKWSILALGKGSIEVISVLKLFSLIDLRATFVEFQEPISIYFAGLYFAMIP